jgi:aryl-alcohol dehydrogenase-like predicted oxidoreductase
MTMKYTTLGKTGLKVSVAGLGCGGFSRLGIPAGKTEDEAARLVLDAVDLGINFIDTAPAYGTEATVGKVLKSIPRQSVVVSTKAFVRRQDEWHTPERVVASLDNSLRLMGTDYVDVFQLHGVLPSEYGYALETLGPALLEQKAKGKIRHIGITEQPVEDFTHEMLERATRDEIWEVFMVGFHMMHQSARKTLFPLTREKRIGTLLMFAVRSIFAKPERVTAAMREAATKGQVEKWLGESAAPLDFLLHTGGARDITEAAYRFARHEPGVDVVLFGTGDAGHLRTNIASLLEPPLPESDRQKLATLFGHLVGVGMDAAPMQTR